MVVLLLGVLGLLLLPVLGISDLLPQHLDLLVVLQHVVLELFLARWVRP